jgi:hypothetical protein
MAVATVVLAILTGVYVWLTHGLLRAQSDPHVVLYARSDELRPTIIELVIHNVGHTVAKDITFEFSRPMFWRAFGVTEKEARPAEPMKGGPLITGIPALGPNEMRRITWGQYGGLKSALGDEVITATVKFRGPRSRAMESAAVLDIKSFGYTDISTRDPALRLVDEVKKLNGSIASLERNLIAALQGRQRDGDADSGKILS